MDNVSSFHERVVMNADRSPRSSRLQREVRYPRQPQVPKAQQAPRPHGREPVWPPISRRNLERPYPRCADSRRRPPRLVPRPRDSTNPPTLVRPWATRSGSACSSRSLSARTRDTPSRSSSTRPGEAHPRAVGGLINSAVGRFLRRGIGGPLARRPRRVPSLGSASRRNRPFLLPCSARGRPSSHVRSSR